MSTGTFDPTMLASLSPEDFLKLMEAAAHANPDAFKQSITGSADIKRLAKQAVGTGGASRTPSIFEPIWPVVLISDSFLTAVGVERAESDEETLGLVLAAIDGKVEGSQEACTLEYISNDRSHRVRFTILSEDNSAQGNLDKALAMVEASNAANFTATSEKYLKRVKSGRVDKATRTELVAEFTKAVTAKKAALDAAAAAAAPMPPMPPSAE